jgi:hypothetical protein
MTTRSALAHALAHAPLTAPKSVAGLAGWVVDGIPVCPECASRIMARGCEALFAGATPVWHDSPKPPEPCSLTHC